MTHVMSCLCLGGKVLQSATCDAVVCCSDVQHIASHWPTLSSTKLSAVAWDHVCPILLTSLKCQLYTLAKDYCNINLMLCLCILFTK